MFPPCLEHITLALSPSAHLRGDPSPRQHRWVKPCSISALRAEQVAMAPQSRRDHVTYSAGNWSWFGVPVTPSLHPQPQSLWREEKGLGARGLGAGFVWMTGMQMADDKMLEAGAGRSCRLGSTCVTLHRGTDYLSPSGRWGAHCSQ